MTQTFKEETAIVIDESAFTKDKLKEYIHNKCDFCNKKITKKNFGYLTRDTTSCKNTFCLVEAIHKHEEKKVIQ